MRSHLAKKGIGGAVKAAQICFYAEELNNGRYGVISFSRGILKVSVGSSPAASELEIQKEELIDEINKRLGLEAVKALRIIVK